MRFAQVLAFAGLALAGKPVYVTEVVTETASVETTSTTSTPTWKTYYETVTVTLPEPETTSKPSPAVLYCILMILTESFKSLPPSTAPPLGPTELTPSLLARSPQAVTSLATPRSPSSLPVPPAPRLPSLSLVWLVLPCSSCKGGASATVENLMRHAESLRRHGPGHDMGKPLIVFHS